MGRITKQEWQEKYGLDDEKMNTLSELVSMFNGRIQKVEATSSMPTKHPWRFEYSGEKGIHFGASNFFKSRSNKKGQWKRETSV